ncbi:hypothetical protein [Botrimarina hoheduenensis]|uniref:Uncharacterized protein n=1 Tax=Botrimarina hoheduenensis TaxID=2528000 RepID=A0A5C5VYX5_9BACT|nr:hypothetical protein [Botrimarina hoheduenensis]TWT43163.1 hypothetical protein Pla111_21130 [Botrimarina hoheduenensis]
MARTYGGVLGALAMATVLARGALAGAGPGGTIQQAIVAAVLLGLVGTVVGAIAERTVDESVRLQLEGQLAELDVEP